MRAFIIRKGMRTIRTHPFTVLFVFAVFFFCCRGASPAAISSALFRVRTADTCFTAFFRTNDIEYRRTNDQRNRGNCDIIHNSHTYTFSAYSYFGSFFCFIITAVNTAAIDTTIAQPTMGIQAAPNEPPVRSVPKKKTRNPML